MTSKHALDDVITDRRRARAIGSILIRCECKLDLPPNSGPLKARVSRIIQAALHRPQAIKPSDYDVVEFLHRKLPAAS
jgi:hypothetical protein